MMQPYEVIVVGAGATGVATAIGLAQAGVKVALVGPADLRRNGRTVALWSGSVQMLRNIGIWQDISTHAEPIITMRLVDDTGSIFTQPPVDFCASELGHDEFGFNIENFWLVQALLAKADLQPNITRFTALVQGVELSPERGIVHLETGQSLSASLLVGAEGRQSPTRAAALIEVRKWNYPQIALTAIFSHRRPHKDVSTEFHTRSGPCTLVPLPPEPDAPNRCSLVWLMRAPEANRRSQLSDAEFAQAVEAQVQYLLGPMQVQGSRAQFPMSGMVAKQMSGHRVALVGEAAHVFPPIGAQGLNLGMRDVAGLIDLVTQAHASGGDLGSDAVLHAYERARRADIELRTRGVDMLNTALLTDLLPADFMRGAGLLALANIAPLRRAIMRQGMNPGNPPPLMRASKMQTIGNRAAGNHE